MDHAFKFFLEDSALRTDFHVGQNLLICALARHFVIVTNLIIYCMDCQSRGTLFGRSPVAFRCYN